MSGNLSFLNWLTIVPAIACFDDDAIERALPMWFAAKSRVEDEPWFLRLVSQILRGKKAPKQFFAKDPFPDEPPRYLRALLYKYRFTRLGDGKDGIWERELVGEWMRPVGAGDSALDNLLDAWRLPHD